MCQFLPAVHALTGCDSNSSFRAHSKSAFKMLQEANGICEESNIGLNPSHVSNSAFVSCKRFVSECMIVKHPLKISMFEISYVSMMFIKSHTSSDKLPPTEDSLK